MHPLLAGSRQPPLLLSYDPRDSQAQLIAERIALNAHEVGISVQVSLSGAEDIRLLRIALPGYAASEPQFNFTLSMMIARLALPGAVPSIGAGFVSAWIARSDRRVIVALIILLLAIFLPAHYRLWEKFPLWYHLTFLGSLILLTLLGARLKSVLELTQHKMT